MFWKIFWEDVLGNVLERRAQRLEEMEMRNANGLDDWQKPLTWKVVRVDDVASLVGVDQRRFGSR